MQGNEVELESLVILVVVVVASFGVSLLLGLTCWSSVTRQERSDLLCVSCLQPRPPPQMTGPPLYR